MVFCQHTSSATGVPVLCDVHYACDLATDSILHFFVSCLLFAMCVVGTDLEWLILHIQYAEIVM